MYQTKKSTHKVKKEQQLSAEPENTAINTAKPSGKESSNGLLSRIPVVNAVTERKRKRRLEKERKAAEKLAKQKAAQKKGVLVLVAMLMVLFAFAGIMSLHEDSDKVEQSQNITETESSQSSHEKDASEKPSDSKAIDVPQVEGTEQEEELKPESEPQTSVVEESPVEEAVIENDAEIPYNQVDDFSALPQTEYAHFDTETAILGNGEDLTVDVVATPAGLVEDDFIFYCEEGELTYTVEEVHDNQPKNETVIRLRINSLSEGYHSFLIVSAYDFLTMGDECPFIEINVHGLGSRDGRIVYVTYTGEKYHYSADCAGGGAIATTLYDVEALDYEPCGKCVG